MSMTRNPLREPLSQDARQQLVAVIDAAGGSPMSAPLTASSVTDDPATHLITMEPAPVACRWRCVGCGRSLSRCVYPTRREDPDCPARQVRAWLTERTNSAEIGYTPERDLPWVGIDPRVPWRWPGRDRDEAPWWTIVHPAPTDTCATRPGGACDGTCARYAR